MELRHLRSFVAISEAGSFSRAAIHLHITQPALSRQMRDLEEEVGARLLDRLIHGVRPTAAGHRFLIGARRILEEAAALLACTRGPKTSAPPPLRIAHFGPVAAQYFSPFLQKTLRRFPDLSLQVEEEVPAVAIKAVKTGRLDATFTGIPTGNQLRGLVTRTIQVVPQDIILPASHRLAKRRGVRLAELRDERWCVWNENEFPGFGRAAIEHARQAGYRMNVAHTGNSLASLFIRVASGDFIGYAPPSARQLPHNGTVFVPLVPPCAMDMPVQLVWRQGSPHHEALAWLSDTMEAAIPPGRVRPEWHDARAVAGAG